ncbi:MAG: 50S ribosomal protein L25 [Sandaracinaceae bacterium]|nr:50S ribosomal protein L25 [Sandaracinaceae bacterium]
MEAQTLKAEVRNGSGKGPARQLRMRGLIPAVFYGPDKKPTNLTVSPVQVAAALSGIFGRNQLVELDFGDGKKELAVVRDLAVDPMSRKPLHVDFYSVALDRPVRAKVPFIANGRAKGVAEGGVLHKIFRELPVVGPPGAIPADVTVDVTPLGMHQGIKVKDLTLPAGVSVALPAERNLVVVTTKEKEKPEDEGVPGAPGAAPAAGAAAAAPAAGGKAPAAAPAKDAKAAAPAKDAKKK